MFDYNSEIEDTNRLRDSLDKFFRVDVKDGGALRLTKVEVTQPELSYVDCLIRNQEYNYKVKCIITNTEGPDKGSIYEAELEFPKQCKNGFLIMSGDGKLKWRSPINLATIYRSIKIRYGELLIGYNLYATTLSPIIDNKGNPVSNPVLKVFRDGGGFDQYDLAGYFINNGIDEDLVRRYLNIVTPISYSDKLGELKIPDDIYETLNNKILQLVKHELNYQNKRILDPITLFDLVKLATTNPNAYEPFSPMDCKFISQFDGVINEINNNYYKIVKQISSDFNRTQTISVGTINSSIKSLFNLQASTYNNIQVSSDSNADAFLSQSKKVYFVTKQRTSNLFESKMELEKEKLVFSDDFVGLICPAKTPESVSLTSIKNELSRSITLRDNKPYIKLLNKNNKLITLDFKSYYKSKILASTSWDYDNNELKPDNNGEISILHLGEYTRVKASDDAYDYKFIDSGAILSYNTSMIPMANHCDSVRLSMASSMIDQSIPTMNSQPPVIYTGTEAEVYKDSDMNFESDYEGTIEGIYEDYIKIKSKDDQIHIVKSPPPSPSMNHTYNRYNLNVKVGDKVKKGSILLTSDSFKNKELALMNQFRTAFMHYKFQEEEDGFIISQSAAEKLTHILDEEVNIRITKDKQFEFNFKIWDTYNTKNIKYDPNKYNEFGLPKIGSKFDKDEPIAFYLLDDDGPDSKLRDAVREDAPDIMYKRIAKIVPGPYNVNKFEVIGVDIKYKQGITTRGNTHIRLLEYYDKEFEEKKSKLESFTGRKEYFSDRYLSKNDPNSLIVTIKTRSYNSVKLGDKLTNRYASKGTVIAIYPDNEMPRLDGPEGEIIDVISSPNAPFNRKNLAQFIEQDLMKISNLAWNNSTKYIQEGNFNQIRKDLNVLHITNKYDTWTDNELAKLHDSYQNFYRIKISSIDNKYTIDKIKSIAKYFGVDLVNGHHLYLPGKLNNLDTNIIDKITKDPVQCGYSELMRLHFFPENKAKATSDSNTRSEELVLGNGSVRSGGQGQGQMEVWTLLSHDTLDDVDKLAGDDKSLIYKNAIDGVKVQMALLGLQVVINDLDKKNNKVQEQLEDVEDTDEQ